LEWALWLSIALFLGVLSLGAASLFVPRSQSFLAVGNRLFALLRPGWIDLASDLDAKPDAPAPLVVNPRNIVAPKVTRSGSVNLPGFSLTFCLFANSAPIWSMRMSLFAPLALSVLLIVIVFYRLKRLEHHIAAASTATASTTLSDKLA
jgi:hypothetical protein